MSEKPLRVVVLFGGAHFHRPLLQELNQVPIARVQEGSPHGALREQRSRHGEILFRTFSITMAYSPGVRT